MKKKIICTALAVAMVLGSGAAAPDRISIPIAAAAEGEKTQTGLAITSNAVVEGDTATIALGYEGLSEDVGITEYEIHVVIPKNYECTAIDNKGGCKFNAKTQKNEFIYHWELPENLMANSIQGDTGELVSFKVKVTDKAVKDCTLEFGDVSVKTYGLYGNATFEELKMKPEPIKFSMTSTEEPTAAPTATSTEAPTVAPTAEPTATPTAEPSTEPTAEPAKEIFMRMKNKDSYMLTNVKDESGNDTLEILQMTVEYPEEVRVVAPIIIDDYTYLPFRFCADMAGLEDAEGKEEVPDRSYRYNNDGGNETLTVTLGEETKIYNSESFKNLNGSLYFKLRDLESMIDAYIVWDGVNKDIYFSTDKTVFDRYVSGSENDGYRIKDKYVKPEFSYIPGYDIHNNVMSYSDIYMDSKGEIKSLNDSLESVNTKYFCASRIYDKVYFVDSKRKG